MVTPDSKVKILDDVIFQEIDGEAVLLNTQSEIYFGLNAMGTRIWELLKGNVQIQTIAESLLDEFDIEPDELQRHLLNFVEQLQSKGLVSIE